MTPYIIQRDTRLADIKGQLNYTIRHGLTLTKGGRVFRVVIC